MAFTSPYVGPFGTEQEAEAYLCEKGWLKDDRGAWVPSCEERMESSSTATVCSMLDPKDPTFRAEPYKYKEVGEMTPMEAINHFLTPEYAALFLGEGVPKDS